MVERRISPEYQAFATARPMGPRDPTEKVHVEFPEVKISNAVAQAMRSQGEGLETLSKATGWVANAMDNLGNQVDKTGNQLWERAQGLQELQNQNALSKAELEFDKYQATKESQFKNLQGDAATEDAYKAYVKDLEDQQKKLREKLPPKTQVQFDRSVMNQIGHAGISAAGHVASELRKSTIATSEAKVNQWKDDLSKTDDINKSKELIEKIEKEITQTQAPARGWTKPQLDEAVRKHVGEGYVGQLLNLARTNPWQALKILDHPENKGLWDDKQYLAAKTHILNEMDRLATRNIGTKVQDDDPDGDLGAKLEKGKKLVEEERKRTGQELPTLGDSVSRDIRGRHHEHEEIVKETNKANNEKVWHITDGLAKGGNGARPKDRDQLFGMGGDEVRAAYWALPQKDRDKIDTQLYKNKMGIFTPSEESEGIKDLLVNMSIEDKARFVDLDLNDVPGLRLSDKTRLKNEQDRIKKEGLNLEANPRISKALHDIHDGGVVDKNLKSNINAYNRFKGAFADAVTVAQKEQGYDKPLTRDQHIEIGNMVKEKIDVPGDWWGDKWKTSTPLYDVVSKIPKATLERLKSDNPGMTDAAALGEYRRERMLDAWNNRFKGPVKK